MLPPLAFELPALIFGLLFGSFLNVCIARLPDHLSIVKPGSHCPECGHPIRWYDNVPLLSWVLLRARCRDCKLSIPWQYPLIELATALWFWIAGGRAFEVYQIPFTGGQLTPMQAVQGYGDIAAFLIAGFLLTGLMVMDWQTHILPDAFTLTGCLIGFLLVCAQAIFLPTGAEDIHLSPRHDLRMSSPGSFAAHGNVFLTGTERVVFGRLLSIVAAALLLWGTAALYKAIRHREGLGLGDVKLLAMIAAFLGFWPALLALFVGVIACAVYAIILLVRRKADMATHLPFGSFLCIGGLIAAAWGEPILAWYKSTLG